MSLSFRIALLLLTVALGACGHAHARINVPASDPASLRQVQLGTVSVVCTDKNAATNAPLQEKLRGWQQLADQQLRATLAASSTQLVQPSATDGTRVPVLSLTSEVRYGNRALRWAVGFGAGAGGVNSRLVATDQSTGTTIFQASAESDLAIGAAGGDVDKVFRQNLDELLQKYRESLAPRS